jgi:hypothetical protein
MSKPQDSHVSVNRWCNLFGGFFSCRVDNELRTEATHYASFRVQDCLTAGNAVSGMEGRTFQIE